MSLPGSEQWLNEHGILSEVWNARPYVRYSPDNLGPVYDEYAELEDDQRKFAVKVATGGAEPYRRDNLAKYPKGHPERVDAGGFLIMRHAPPGLERFGPVYAELRPDNAVATKSRTWHYHGPRPYPEHVAIDAKTGRPCKPKAAGGGPIAESNLHTTKSMDAHIRRDKFEDDHFPGDPRLDQVHSHQDVAKYCFISSAWVTQQIQRKDGSWYDHKEKDESESIARRLDVHPLAADRLGAGLVYVGLEGCIKADAILSEILRRDIDVSVVSFPSVTLWNAGAELGEFVERHLLGKRVVIVCDSDGARNGLVRTQALLLRSFLHNRGARDTEVVAPPYPGSEQKDGSWVVDPAQLDEKGKPLLNGVDDFLGAGHELRELKRLGNQVDADLLQWVLEHPRKSKGHDYRADAFDAVALEGICAHADPSDGTYLSSAEMLATVMELDEPPRAPIRVVPYRERKPTLPARIQRMQRALRSLVDRGLLEKVSGSEEVRPKMVRTSKGWRTFGWDYSDRPRYRIVPPDLWPKHLSRRELSELPLADYYNRVADHLQNSRKANVKFDAIGEMQMEVATATLTAIDDRLARIELLETMHAETMDNIRSTVDQVAARLGDEDFTRRARELGYID
jgi:hypothetical protein